MAFYRNSYVPAFTSNDTYGNFYDASKVSLITVPDRLKNYDLDVRKAAATTTAAEYGDFLRGWQHGGDSRGNNAQLGYPRLYRQQQELQQFGSEGPRDLRQLPPPLEDAAPPLPSFHHHPPLPPPPPLSEVAPAAAQLPETTGQAAPPPGFQRRHEQPLSQLLPPSTPPPTPPQPLAQPQQQFAPPYRAPRARSPPPPIDISAYRSNPEAYTGGQQLRHSQAQQQPPQPPPPPPLRLSGREVHLPNIESVEVRMRDNSKMVLDVMDFYRRYLRD